MTTPRKIVLFIFIVVAGILGSVYSLWYVGGLVVITPVLLDYIINRVPHNSKLSKNIINALQVSPMLVIDLIPKMGLYHMDNCFPNGKYDPHHPYARSVIAIKLELDLLEKRGRVSWIQIRNHGYADPCMDHWLNNFVGRQYELIK